MIVLITGVPGTGKTTISKILSKKTGYPLVQTNKLIAEKGLWGRVEEGAKVVYIKKLEKLLNSLIKKEKDLIIEGHLLCDMKLKADYVIVLRTKPPVLRKRQERRRYPKKKIYENLMAEVLDYCTINAEQRYRKTYEVDTSKGPAKSVSGCMSILGGKGESFTPGRINWSAYMEKMAEDQKGFNTPK